MRGDRLKCQSRPPDLRVKESPPRKPLGQWLVENMPRGTNLEIPGDRNVSGREIPFLSEE